MIPELEAFVRGQTNDSSGTWSFIMLHNGYGYRNPKVSFIAFKDGHPNSFLKTVRYPKDNSVIARAHDRLVQVNESASHGATSFEIPQALWCASLGEVFVSAETIVSGHPLDVKNKSDVNTVLDQIEAFGLQRRDGSYGEGEVDILFHQLVEESRLSEKGLLDSLNHLYQRVKDYAAGEEVGLDRMRAHGDANPGNLLVAEGGRIAVVDWDRYADIEMPLFDVLTLMERTMSSDVNFISIYHERLERFVLALKKTDRILPLLVFFYALLTDWRKREHYLPWEGPLLDEILQKHVEETMERVRQVYPF